MKTHTSHLSQIIYVHQSKAGMIPNIYDRVYKFLSFSADFTPWNNLRQDSDWSLSWVSNLDKNTVLGLFRLRQTLDFSHHGHRKENAPYTVSAWKYCRVKFYIL